MREDFSRTVERITAGSLRASYTEMLSKAKASIIRLKGHFPHLDELQRTGSVFKLRTNATISKKGSRPFR